MTMRTPEELKKLIALWDKMSWNAEDKINRWWKNHTEDINEFEDYQANQISEKERLYQEQIDQEKEDNKLLMNPGWR